eukprot:4575075-Amphidinium_carterae.1
MLSNNRYEQKTNLTQYVVKTPNKFDSFFKTCPQQAICKLSIQIHNSQQMIREANCQVQGVTRRASVNIERHVAGLSNSVSYTHLRAHETEADL